MSRKLIGILVGTMLMTGCMGTGMVNITNIAPVYETSYEVKNGHQLNIGDLEKKLKETESQVQVNEVYNELIYTKPYAITSENLNGLVTIHNNPSEAYNQEIKSIRLDINHENEEIISNPVIESIAEVIGEEAIIPWIAKNEELLRKSIEENKEAEEPNKNFYDPVNKIRFSQRGGNNRDSIMDILKIGRDYIIFESRLEEESSEIRFNWGVPPLALKELYGVVAELEDKEFLTTDYIEGVGGNKATLMTPEYYLANTGSYYYNYTDNIISNIDKTISYKVMYDPSKTKGYSMQLQGLMDADESHIVKIEDLVGMDTMVRAMGMEGQDFADVTAKINGELIKAREILNPNLQQDYYSEGNVSGYHYSLYIPSGIEIYRYGVLIEPIE